MDSDSKPGFKHILIISSVTKRCQGLAAALQKSLRELKFSYLNPVTDLLPDSQFDWSDIDLMIIDLSRNKSPIYDWYSSTENRAGMPPAIFMGHPASINDAGYFYRAGASDYLDMRGLKRARLIRSLAITSSMAEKRKAVPRNEQLEDKDKGDKPFSLKATKETEALSTVNPAVSQDRETRAEFLNTGVMSILDRDAIKNMPRKNPAQNTDPTSNT